MTVTSVIAAVSFFAASAEPVQACPVCAPLPKSTKADRLIESQQVVFARLHPDRPFSYRVVEVLKGASAVADLDCFADSVTRHRLSASPHDVVVLVRADDAAAWHSLGVADREYQQIVQRILVQAAEWSGRGGIQKRHEYFRTLFGHPNRAIFELAYLELGRAPYETIQELGKTLSREELTPVLTRREYIEWRSLAILLLAQQSDSGSRDMITKSFDSCQRYALTKNLAAWTTAWLEISDQQAVEQIETLYLKDADRKDAEIRAVLTALLIHGSQDDSQRKPRIVALFRTAWHHHPAAVRQLVRESADWGASRYSGVFRELEAMIAGSTEAADQTTKRTSSTVSQ